MFSSHVITLMLAAQDGLLNQPPGDMPIVDDARWSASLTSNSVGALVVWVVLLIVLQAATWPIARILFGRFPDRGWAFARLLTLLLTAYPVWLLASLEAIAFRAVWCGIALVAAAAMAWFGPWRSTRTLRRRTTQSWFRNPAIVVVEVVFWVVFLWFLAYRLINPDSWHVAWGGEKPMEFAHLNAILRSAHFPPGDPWYAGGTLNYYYYGGYLVAFLLKLTGIPSEIGFNLAQPTVIAMLAAAAWSVGAALGERVGRRTVWAITGGFMSVFLVNIAGNLVVFARLVTGIRDGLVPFDDYVYWFWDPRQIVPRTINEFPYFTATYADLHAHVIAMPITILVVGLCLNLAIDARPMLLALAQPLARTADIGLVVSRLTFIGLALGSLAMTNAWDVPVYAAVAFVSILLATRLVRSWWRRVCFSTALTGGSALFAWLVALPFTTNFLTRYGEIGTVSDRSPLVAIEAHFGVFLLVISFGLITISSRGWDGRPRFAHPAVFVTVLLAILFWRWSVSDDGASAIELADSITVLFVTGWLLASVGLALPERLDLGLPRVVGWLIALAAWIGVLWSLGAGMVAFALFAGIGAAAALVWLQRVSIGVRFVAMLVAAGMFVAAGVEVVYLVDDLGEGVWYRMNTVFKFYNAVWVLFALGSSGLVVFMLREALDGQAAISTSEDLQVPEAGSPVTPIEPETPAPGNTPASVPERDTVWTSTSLNQPGAGDPFVDPARTDGGAFQPATPNELPRSAGDSHGLGHPGDGVAPYGTTPTPVPPPAPRVPGQWTVAWAEAGVVVAAILMILSLSYPVFSTGVRLNQHFPQDGRHWTLNALDWMDYGEIDTGTTSLTYAGDRAAIEWFNENVGGTPVIAEAVLGAYMCAGSRISVHTGLPAVVGWVWHETQQRGVTDLYQREAAMRDLYTSGDPGVILEVIERYGIEYIVVGDLERWYPARNCNTVDNADGIAALEGLTGTTLEVAFESGTTTVYRVNPER